MAKFIVTENENVTHEIAEDIEEAKSIVEGMVDDGVDPDEITVYRVASEMSVEIEKEVILTEI